MTTSKVEQRAIDRVRRICKQEMLVKAAPARFFVPPYVGGNGWIGARIDRAPDWKAIEELVKEAYRLIAPPRLVALLDAAKPARRSR